jgi:signal transduction histidine kinase
VWHVPFAPGAFSEDGLAVRSAASKIGPLLAAIVLILRAAPAGSADTKNILVLFSNSRLLPANIDAERGLNEAFANSADRRVEMFTEFLDVPRFGGEPYSRTLSTYLSEKLASRPPDAIVVGGEDALDFVLRHHTTLFPRVPVVHMGVSGLHLRSLPPLPANVVGVPVEYDFSGTIELALKWHPRARHLIVVTGHSARDREWEAQLRGEVPRFAGRATAEFLAGLPTGALLGRLRQLGQDAVVFTPGYFEDGDGHLFTPRDSARLIAGASAAPVYGPFDTFIGTGVIGGRMPTFEEMGRQAAGIVIRLLAGADPASLHLPDSASTNVNVDWRQIRRWGIDEHAVPAGAVWHFREPSFWEAHRTAAVAAIIVFLLQAGLIGALAVERRRRRKAELADQTHRFELAHASRLATVGELTASIAHEINQPLGAILSNADAAELILESGPDRRDQLRQILADIRRDDLRASEVIRRLRSLLARKKVERQPFELNEAVSDIGPILRGEARRRRITLDIRPAATAATVVGDRIQLQQVLIHLVLNAMDAVEGVPAERRTIVMSVEKVAGGVAVTVRDRGQGIAPEHFPRLFESFFTTKPSGMGLGLSIARSLIEAHGGRIWAENGAGEGADFHVELPVPDGPGLPPPEPA